MRAPLNARRLKAELMKRGLTQEDFAGKAGISPTTVSMACNGAAVNPRTLIRISKALVEIPVLPGADDLVDLSAGLAATGT